MLRHAGKLLNDYAEMRLHVPVINFSFVILNIISKKETKKVLLSAAMFIGSYISGLVPLGFSLRKDQIKQLNVAGSGLLIGTALSVIIPEGVSALYNLKNEDGELNISNLNE